MSDEVLQALAKALGPYIGQGAKATGVETIGTYMYEGGGLFGRADGSSTLINALVGPIGFEKYLNWYGADTIKEFTDAWTEIELGTTKQTTGCGTCPTAYMRACAQFYCLGRFCAQSQELQFDRLALRQHSNIPIKNLFGAITAADGTVLVPMGAAITDEFYTESAMVGYNLRYRNAQMLWTGNPVNNVGTSYQEYMGFQLIVNTGKYDGYTQLYCSALDSFLMNMNFNGFTTDGTYSVRSWFRRMVNQFKVRANRAGLDWDSAQMYIVMTPNQWDCVARTYACAGMDLCSIGNDANAVSFNGDQAQARYEEYLRSMALPIDGRLYPVVLDSQIPETTGQANGTCSDIYFIPLGIIIFIYYLEIRRHRKFNDFVLNLIHFAHPAYFLLIIIAYPK